MTMQVRAFKSVVHRLLTSTPVPERLSSHDAVVVECIARGGGKTRWYYCRDTAALDAIEAELRPGSLVTFYFDGRIRRAVLNPEIRSEIEKTIKTVGEVVVGVLRNDAFHIDVDFIGDFSDFDEDFLAAAAPPAVIFFGAFPAADNDGTHAVTMTLPDSDGVVRAHPY